LWGWNPGFDWEGRDDAFDPSFNTIWVSHEYGKTIGWEFLEGRDFSKEFPADINGIVINESALKLMGLRNPVGETVTWKTQWNEGGTFKIIGVVKDMVKGSPFDKTEPSVIFLSEHDDLGWLYIKINPAVSSGDALPGIENAFSKIITSAPFDYAFADDAYDSKFRGEERVGKLAGFFSVLAVMISCLGLFGLASYTAQQRTKEIGIRKVLGASISNLWQMLSKDFVMLVMISWIVAMPSAFLFMEKWLQQYSYRTAISWNVFVAVGVGSLLITLFTVSFQAIKAAMENPVNILKSE
jgi:hypothetical protein